MEAPEHKSESQKHVNLKEVVLDRIDSTHVEPYSRWHFLYQESFVWMLWVLSVLVGALATAVMLFVFKYQQFAVYEATHENFFTFMVEALPYVWLLLFAVMAAVAVFNLKHTKRGYRHSVSTVLLSSLAFSVFGGVALQSYGFGFTVDQMLGQHMSMYPSQEKFEKRVWQMPEEGRLIGKQVLSTVAPTSTIIFEDIDGNRWNFCVDELSEKDLELLATKQTVRIVGTTTDAGMFAFHACGAMPWMFEREMPRQALLEERKEFIQKAKTHMLRAEAQLDAFEDRFINIDEDNEEEEERRRRAKADDDLGLCAETATIKRLEGTE